MAEILGAETAAARDQARPGDVAGAVHALVGEYERIGDANVRWAASRPPRQPRRRCSTRPGRSHQAWLADDVRRPPADAAGRRRRAVNALHAATDVYTWKLLRRDLRPQPRRDRTTIVDLVAGVLEERPNP